MLFSITTYNRSHLAIPSIKKLFSLLEKEDEIIIQDDGSYEISITHFLETLKERTQMQVEILFDNHNGADHNNIHRLDTLDEIKDDSFIYLTDDDIQYSHHFYMQLMQMKDFMEENPVFFAGTLFNPDGERLGRHKILNPNKPFKYKDANYYAKESMGGCSMLIRVKDFKEAMKYYQSDEYKGIHSWDWGICRYAEINDMILLTTENSYVQHVGNVGLNSFPLCYDFADNFVS